MALQGLFRDIIIIERRPQSHSGVCGACRQMPDPVSLGRGLAEGVVTYFVSGERTQRVMYLPGWALKLVTGWSVVASDAEPEWIFQT